MKTRLSLLLALLSLAACADNNASIRVAAICAPTDDCTFGATCDAETIGQNEIDVGVTNILWMMLQVDNLTPNNGSPANFRTNTNDAWVQEYEVDYSGVLPKTTSPILGSAYVPAGGSAVISVKAVNEATGATLASIPAGSYVDLVAKLKLKGVYADTTKFETGEFQIPFRACNGCFVPLACTAPAVAVYCPNAGQSPVNPSCVTP